MLIMLLLKNINNINIRILNTFILGWLLLIDEQILKSYLQVDILHFISSVILLTMFALSSKNSY